jgi:1-aminocyclopropane-1-carboxylate deaminase/D-cysteine desulfhydrase-like pyridoxal-dependent ACC family enzyme
MKMNIKEIQIEFTPIIDQRTKQAEIELVLARFDRIHPIVSGNKLFKLHFFVEELLKTPKKYLVTSGGAYSNHLSASAYYCKMYGIRCFGVVRGEASNSTSHTLNFCRELGMEIIFCSRTDFRDLNEHAAATLLNLSESDLLYVPSGGFHPLGATGARIMFDLIQPNAPTHIVMAMGTGTTMAGFSLANENEIELIGVSALKGMNDWNDRFNYLSSNDNHKKPIIWDDFHCGGYAKYNGALIDTMNELYINHAIETDFVYTGKMMSAVFHQIEQGYFKAGSKVICIHTGGLQGNKGLDSDLLRF